MRISQNNSYNYKSIKYTNNKPVQNTTSTVSFGHVLTLHYNKGFIQFTKTSPTEIFHTFKKVFQKKSHHTHSPEQRAFLRRLKSKYNELNYYASEHTTEIPNIINEISELVKKPKEIHSDIIKSLQVPLSEIKNIFQIADTNKKLQFVLDFNSSVLKNKFNRETEYYPNIISDILKSPNSKEYIEHAENYKSYFLLNKDKSTVVSDLDQLVKFKTFSTEDFDKLLKEEKAKNFYDSYLLSSPVLNREVYAEFADNYKSYILDMIMVKDHISQENFQSGIDKSLLKIAQSTTKDNVSVRKHILNSYYAQGNSANQIQDYAQIANIFEIINGSKDAQAFMKKAKKHDLQFRNITELENILNNVPHKKLKIFFNNVVNIFNISKDADRTSVLKEEIENAMFTTPKHEEKLKREVKYKLAKKESKVAKFARYVSNEVNKIKYNLSMKEEQQKQIAKEVELTLTTAQEAPIVQNIQKETQSAAKAVMQPENTFARTAEKEIAPKTADVDVLPKAEKPISKVERRKLRLKENVLKLVTPKLGAKTLEDQQLDYGKYATKLRFEMLPEIFASVADTRKADRLAGRKKHLSSNKDAIELFKLINGRNKKLVNYLLKKRNGDGTRMFEVREIIDLIDKTERHIRFSQLKPDGYTTEQAKLLYEGMLDEKIQLFGKLTRIRNAKPKSKITK